MKLFYRVLIHLLIGIAVVLSAWAVCFYMAIVDEINDMLATLDINNTNELQKVAEEIRERARHGRVCTHHCVRRGYRYLRS